VSYHKVGSRVLARIDDREKVWAPGVLVEFHYPTKGWPRCYGVEFEKSVEGRRLWYFTKRWVIADTPRNRCSRFVRV
jgi:hypothetical protein